MRVMMHRAKRQKVEAEAEAEEEEELLQDDLAMGRRERKVRVEGYESDSGEEEEEEEDGEEDGEIGEIDSKREFDMLHERGGGERGQVPLDAFNMRHEEDEGRFNKDGEWIANLPDEEAYKDDWLRDVSRADIHAAARAHHQHADEVPPSPPIADLLHQLVESLRQTETPMEALARLRKKTERREEVEAITAAADGLLMRMNGYVYDEPREALLRRYTRITGTPWAAKEEWWEYQFPGQKEIHGPYPREQMEDWREYLTDALVRRQGEDFTSLDESGLDGCLYD